MIFQGYQGFSRECDVHRGIAFTGENGKVKNGGSGKKGKVSSNTVFECSIDYE